MRGILILAGLLAFSAEAQTNYVTNWIAAPSNYRVISNQVYDVNLSKKWVSVAISPEFIFSGASAPGARGLLTKISPSGNVTILNFPYDKSAFTYGGYQDAWVRSKAGSARVFPIQSSTNWTPAGIIESIQWTYDFGLPCTNKIPVVIRR